MTEEMNSLLEERAVISRRGRPLSLAFSCVVHLVAVFWLFFPRLGSAAPGEVFPAPGFVQVRMVSEPPGGKPAAETRIVDEAPAPPPEPVSEPAPRLVEAIPENKPPARKPKKETPPTPPPATRQAARPVEGGQPANQAGGRAAASGSVGLGSGAGQGGLVGMDGLDTRFSWYLDLVVSRISAVWQEPYLDARYGKTYRVTVYFIIHRNGSLSDVRVEETSGVDLLDLSAVRSIGEASPLPPLPQDFRGDELGVHFWFDYKRD
jgi:protein TonB